MPIYTYHCDNCGVQFDRRQNFSDPPLTWCPECSKKTLRKVYQPVGIVFKGSGFYSTDHRSPSGGSRSGQTKNEETEKSETKPASTESTSQSTDKNASTASKED
jgi:putative FmdB family regulatory protein